MFTRDAASGAIDTVVCVGGTIKRSVAQNEAPTTQLNMVYVNKASGQTYGTCPMLSSMMSKETVEALMHFLDCAEADFGSQVFESGQISLPGLVAQGGRAESNEPLRRRGLGDGR